MPNTTVSANVRFRRTKYTNAQQPELLLVNPQAARRDRSALRLCGFTYASFQVTLPILFLHTRIVLLFDTRVLTLTYAGLLPLSRSSSHRCIPRKLRFSTTTATCSSELQPPTLETTAKAIEIGNTTQLSHVRNCAAGTFIRLPLPQHCHDKWIHCTLR